MSHGFIQHPSHNNQLDTKKRQYRLRFPLIVQSFDTLEFPLIYNNKQKYMGLSTKKEAESNFGLVFSPKNKLSHQ